jgi:hypothetical protein
MPRFKARIDNMATNKPCAAGNNNIHDEPGMVRLVTRVTFWVMWQLDLLEKNAEYYAVLVYQAS